MSKSMVMGMNLHFLNKIFKINMKNESKSTGKAKVIGIFIFNFKPNYDKIFLGLCKEVEQ